MNDHLESDSVTTESLAPAAGEPVTITATVAAWYYQTDYSRPESLYEMASKGQGTDLVSCLALTGPPDREKFSDYVRVGEADVTVRLYPRNQLTGREIAALNAKLDAARAAYLQMQSEIMDRINKLQALEMTVEA
jgi:hypothetical protein